MNYIRSLDSFDFQAPEILRRFDNLILNQFVIILQRWKHYAANYR